MRKKIVILSLHLGYGGVEKAITSLANSLAKLDKYNIEVVSIYRLYDKPVFDFDEKVKIIYYLLDLVLIEKNGKRLFII